MNQLIWIGTSYKDLLAFPKDAKQIAGYGLDRIQRRENPPDWKPMPSLGKGVKELRIHCENEYKVWERICNVLSNRA